MKEIEKKEQEAFETWGIARKAADQARQIVRALKKSGNDEEARKAVVFWADVFYAEEQAEKAWDEAFSALWEQNGS